MSFLILPFFSYFCFFFCLATIFYILYKDRKAIVNIFCSLFIFCFALWSFGKIFVNNPNASLESAIFWYDMSSFGWIFFSYFFLLFTQAYIDQKKLLKRKWLYVVLFFIPLAILIRKLTGGLFVDYIPMYYGWAYVWENGFWTYLFYFYYAFGMSFSLLMLFIFGVRTKYRIRKKQVKIMIITALSVLPIGSVVSILLPRLGYYYIPSVSDVFAVVWVLGVVYSIIKYNFLNISAQSAAENIISTMSDALFLANKNGEIIRANKTASLLSGFEIDELNNKNINDLFEENNFFNLIFDQARHGKALKNYETKIRTKGRKKNIEVVFSNSLFKDDNGDLLGVICIAKDISEIKKIEKELKLKNIELEDNIKKIEESKKKVSLILESLDEEREKSENEKEKNYSILASFNDPIFFIDSLGEIGLYNKAAEKVFFISENIDGLKIKNDDDFSFENFKKILKKDFKVNKIFNEENEKLFEELEVEIDGKLLFYKITSTEVCDKNNECFGHIKVFYNLTREREIDRIKSEFISIAAHQLRTPLSAIKWVIKMILDGDAGKLNKEQEDLLGKGYKSNERIIQLVNDLLNVSRIEEGRFNFDFQKQDFQKIINEIVENEESLLAKKHIKFKIIKPDKIPMVYVDKEKITLVLQNLLENAIKYTPNYGKIEIIITEEGDYLSVKVADNGVGIPKEDISKLFSKFFRAKNVVRMQTEGSGLGLFIAKNIIEKHNGKITINSQEGRGTEMGFTIPIKKVKII